MRELRTLLLILFIDCLTTLFSQDHVLVRYLLRGVTPPSHSISAILTYTSYVLFLIHSWYNDIYYIHVYIYYYSFRASVEHYSNKPTDTASNGTSYELKEALCNGAGEKLDQEVSLRVVAKRR